MMLHSAPMWPQTEVNKSVSAYELNTSIDQTVGRRSQQLLANAAYSSWADPRLRPLSKQHFGLKRPAKNSCVVNTCAFPLSSRNYATIENKSHAAAGTILQHAGSRAWRKYHVYP